MTKAFGESFRFQVTFIRDGVVFIVRFSVTDDVKPQGSLPDTKFSEDVLEGLRRQVPAPDASDGQSSLAQFLGPKLVGLLGLHQSSKVGQGIQGLLDLLLVP